MKATVAVRPFQAAFGRVAPTAPMRSPKPVLQNVRLDVPGGGAPLAVTATDLEVALRVELPAGEVPGPGAALLHAQRVGSILGALADQGVDSLVLETTAAGVRLASEDGRYDWTLGSEDPELFPTFPGPGAEGPVVLPAEALARLIRLTIYATDVQSTRYALGGVLFACGPGAGLMLVATDGRRLSRAVAAPAGGGSAPTIAGTPIVPVKALRALLPLLDAAGGDPVEVRLGALSADFAVPNARLHARLAEGRFPRWEDILPPPQPVRSTFPLGALIPALEAAAITTGDGSRGVDVAVRADRWELGARTVDVGCSRVVADGPTEGLGGAPDGATLEVAFDPRYLLDALKALRSATRDADANVVVGFLDGRNAVSLACAEAGFDGVIMPLTKSE